MDLGAAPEANPAWVVTTDKSDSNFGEELDAAGDVDGDGFGDIIVGAPEYSDLEQSDGRAFLYRGAATHMSTVPAWTDSSGGVRRGIFGVSVLGAGDVDADGLDDLLIGSTGYAGVDFDQPAVLLFTGGVDGFGAGPS